MAGAAGLEGITGAATGAGWPVIGSFGGAGFGAEKGGWAVVVGFAMVGMAPGSAPGVGGRGGSGLAVGVAGTLAAGTLAGIFLISSGEVITGVSEMTGLTTGESSGEPGRFFLTIGLTGGTGLRNLEV